VTRDPIVEEIHETRRRIMAECDNDPQKYFARLRALGDTHRDRLVDLSKRERELPCAPK
jgi:hypothetical protein